MLAIKWRFGDPLLLKSTPFPHFISLFISLYWAEIKTSNLVGRLIVASASLGMINITFKGAWSCHVIHLNFGGTNYISGTAEARVIKFCTHV